MPAFLSADLHPLVILAATALLCVIGGLIPFSPMEAMIVGLAVAVRPAMVVPVIVVATITQMASKILVYAGGSAGTPAGSRRRAIIDSARNRLVGRRSVRLTTTFVSAVVGLPPFYAVTVAYGALRLPLVEYLITGTAGRTLRLATMVIAGRLLAPAIPLPQTTPAAPVTIAVSQMGAEGRP